MLSRKSLNVAIDHCWWFSGRKTNFYIWFFWISFKCNGSSCSHWICLRLDLHQVNGDVTLLNPTRKSWTSPYPPLPNRCPCPIKKLTNLLSKMLNKCSHHIKRCLMIERKPLIRHLASNKLLKWKFVKEFHFFAIKWCQSLYNDCPSETRYLGYSILNPQFQVHP